MPKVFLGGTVNGSNWRDILIPMLKIDYFNPVVENWNEEALEKEIYEREHCDYVLYLLSPKMNGFYAIAELIDDSHKRPEKTIFSFLTEDGDSVFNPHQIKSLKATAKLAATNGAKYCESIEELAQFLNEISSNS